MLHQNKRKNEINSLQYVLYDAGIFRRDTIVVIFKLIYRTSANRRGFFMLKINKLKILFKPEIKEQYENLWREKKNIRENAKFLSIQSLLKTKVHKALRT